MPVPAPGVLVPDCPVTVPGRPEIVRLRQLAREGVTVLLGDDAPAPALPESLTGDLPVAVHRMRDLDAGPTLREALERALRRGLGPPSRRARGRRAHARPAEVTAAVARLLSRPVPSPVPA